MAAMGRNDGEIVVFRMSGVIIALPPNAPGEWSRP
jgi:hypothetical protein